MKQNLLSKFKYFLLPPIAAMAALSFTPPGWALPLSPGDRIRINIPSDEVLPQNTPESCRFSGIYEVNLDGKIYLPLIEPLQVVGIESDEINQRLRTSLVQGGYFQPDFLQISTSIVQWAPIQVNVVGATFKPGRILVEETLPEEGRTTSTERIEPFTVSGSYPSGRFLTAALRAAGGIRPTADFANVRLVRGREEIIIDLTAVFTGEAFEDIPLIAGDQTIVPALPQVQNEIVRPSQVTPSEIAEKESKERSINSFEISPSS